MAESNNAEIARFLGVTRQRVHQLYRRGMTAELRKRSKYGEQIIVLLRRIKRFEEAPNGQFTAHEWRIVQDLARAGAVEFVGKTHVRLNPDVVEVGDG